MNSDALLQVRLSAGYGGKNVLNDLQFEMQRGEVLGLVGTSGAGKSTLVWSLLGLLPWRSGKTDGEVLLNGVDLLSRPERELRKLRGRNVALIPQSPMTSLNSAISLQRHFEQAWLAHKRGGVSELRGKIATLMTEVQLPGDAGFLRRRPGQISVGQAQRVLIALALLHNPELIVADEPTSALDPVTQTQIIGLLRKLNRTHGTALLYISHDLVSVLQLCDRVAVLEAGTIVESLPVVQVGRACHPATVALLNALPVSADLILAHRPGIQSEADSCVSI